ncbi:hypothetical protein [Jiulongibacter sp. NS-SX5]|uniref:hypothetical protein n=1 Tax=Jiulongibacter sp. NS-SX5 TaxID=3463854 RepID=UPI00405960F0
MKLNETQIQDLFHFTERHYVEHYDVQVEIVDHLASAIEERLEKNPNQVYEQVLDDVYQSFGPMGLSGFVDSMEKRVYERGRREALKEFKSFFTIPKIFLTLILFVATCFFVDIMPSSIYVPSLLVIVVSTAAIMLTVYFLRKRRIIKPFISWQKVLKNNYVGVWLVVFNFGFNQNSMDIFPGFNYLFAIGSVAFVISSIADYQVMEKTFTNLRKQYPEAFA